jgi:predicted ATPase
MAEALLRADPAAHVVTTSREPLRAEGEWTYRLPPLAVPGPDLKDEDDLVRHGAVRLFITRAQAVDPHIVMDCHITETIAAICRRLDGIPLAIELAAARTAALGIEQIGGRLDDRFRLLASGRRTALPRHQTMHATLDWSHELLTVPEQVVLRRLAIFVGSFELEGASAVATSPELAPSDVIDTLANLVLKSLVDRTTTGYRLLETPRAFAFDKLVESGELEAVSRRHAEYHRICFERAEIEWDTRAEAEWLADYGPKIDDVRAALDWAFSSGSDTSVGVALTAAVVPLWMELSLLQECCNRVERALSTLEAAASRDPRWEMKLNVALAASLLYIRGVMPELGAIWTRALEIAEALGEREYQLRALRGLHTFYNGRHFPSSLDIAKKFCLVAEQQSHQNDRLVGDGMVGLSQHYLGDQTSARTHIERMLANFFAPHDGSHYYAIRFRFDQQSARLVLSRILWLQGFPDQAMQTAKSAVEDALEINDVISTCSVLAHAACPIAVWTGDLEAAQRHMKVLLDLSSRYSLPFWSKLGGMFEALLAVKHGEVADGLRSLRSRFDELDERLPASSKLKFQSEIAEFLGRAGQIADALAVADQAIERCEQTGERWVFPELLRIRGELLLLGGRSTAAKAESHFLEAIALAHRQCAHSWELRAAMSLTRLLRDQRRNAEAIAVIKPIYKSFTEGFSTVDLTAAKALIDNLQVTG